MHGIVPRTPLDETIAPNLAGFLGQGPVRIGNEAGGQIQHDVYGSVILGATQMFIDERLPHMGGVPLFRQLERLGEQAARFALEPDAGIWEYRGRLRVHTYSAALCWAACDRLGQIARRLQLDERARHWTAIAEGLRNSILEGAWDEKRSAITGAFGVPHLDASTLLLAEFGLLAHNDPRFIKTCDAVGRELMRNNRIMRYTADDDFGAPEAAFLVCNFWYMDALAALGRRTEARDMFIDILASRNSFGMLSEDIHPVTGELWGNFPQTYSMAGIINTAMRLSGSWEDAWARASS